MVLQTQDVYQVESRSGVTIASNGVSSTRFIFDGEASLEDFMNELDNYNIDSFLNTLTPYNYQAFYNSTGMHLDSIDSFDEPVLQAILNSYGVVEIDGYLIKLHPTRNMYAVLPNTASPINQQTFERAASDTDLFNVPFGSISFNRL